MTKMSVLRDAIGVEDLATVIYTMEAELSYKDVLGELRGSLKGRMPGVYKLSKVSTVYFTIVKLDEYSADDEMDMVYGEGRVNKLVMDITKDLPRFARESRSLAQFRMKLLEHYGRSTFLCGVASVYMNKAIEKALPTLVD